MNGQQHEMILQRVHHPGAEEWYCPSCGRRLLVKWVPKFRRIVLEIGDDYAIHTGGQEGLQMGAAQARAVDVLVEKEDSQSLIDDSRLLPWIEWLDEIDFESLWDNKP